MDLEQALHTRRTIHKYLPEPVAQGDLDKIMSAGHMAPCHRLTWPWRFIQVGPETREKIVPVAIACKTVKRERTPELEKSVRGKILTSGALIVVTQVRCEDAFRAKEDYAAVSCAIQNMMLMGHSLGLGTKWSTGGVTTHPDTYGVLGVDADKEEIVGFVWVGTPAAVPSIKRPDVSDVKRLLP